MAVMDLMGKQTVNAQTIEGDDSFDVVIIGGALSGAATALVLQREQPGLKVLIVVPFFYLMRTYNRRFAQIARARRLRNHLGIRNNSRRFLLQGYTFSPSSSFPIARALAEWACLEMKEGWRSWFAPNSPKMPAKVSQPLAMAQPAPVVSSSS